MSPPVPKRMGREGEESPGSLPRLRGIWERERTRSETLVGVGAGRGENNGDFKDVLLCRRQFNSSESHELFGKILSCSSMILYLNWCSGECLGG